MPSNQWATCCVLHCCTGQDMYCDGRVLLDVGCWKHIPLTCYKWKSVAQRVLIEDWFNIDDVKYNFIGAGHAKADQFYGKPRFIYRFWPFSTIYRLAFSDTPNCMVNYTKFSVVFPCNYLQSQPHQHAILYTTYIDIISTECAGSEVIRVSPGVHVVFTGHSTWTRRDRRHTLS